MVADPGGGTITVVDQIAASTGSDEVSRIRANGTLKMLDHGDGCIIAKREYLHHD
jgi:hypothetical protein